MSSFWLRRARRAIAQQDWAAIPDDGREYLVIEVNSTGRVSPDYRAQVQQALADGWVHVADLPSQATHVGLYSRPRPVWPPPMETKYMGALARTVTRRPARLSPAECAIQRRGLGDRPARCRDRQWQVLQWRVIDCLTFMAIASRLGVSLMRAHQLGARARYYWRRANKASTAGGRQWDG